MRFIISFNFGHICIKVMCVDCICSYRFEFHIAWRRKGDGMSQNIDQRFLYELLEREAQVAHEEYDRILQREQQIYNDYANFNNMNQELEIQLAKAEAQGLSDDQALFIRQRFDNIGTMEMDPEVIDAIRAKTVNEVQLANIQQSYRGDEVYINLDDKVIANTENYRHEISCWISERDLCQESITALNNNCPTTEVMELRSLYRTTEQTPDILSEKIQNCVVNSLKDSNLIYQQSGDKLVYDGIAQNTRETVNDLSIGDFAYSTQEHHQPENERALRYELEKELNKANISEAEKKTIWTDFEKTNEFSDPDVAFNSKEKIIELVKKANEVQEYDSLLDQSLMAVDDGFSQDSQKVLQLSAEKEAALEQQIDEKENPFALDEDISIESVAQDFEIKDLEDRERGLDDDNKRDENDLTNDLRLEEYKQDFSLSLEKAMEECKNTGNKATFKINDNTINIIPSVNKDGKKDVSIFLNGEKSSISKVTDKVFGKALDKAADVTAVTKAIKTVTKVIEKIKEQAQKTKEKMMEAMEQGVR